MVTTINRFSPWAALGESIGQGLGQGVQAAGNIATQKGLLQKSFGKVSELGRNSNATPLQQSLGLLEAFAGIPGSERYVGQILPQLLEISQKGGVPSIDSLTNGQPSVSDMVGIGAGQQSIPGVQQPGFQGQPRQQIQPQAQAQTQTPQPSIQQTPPIEDRTQPSSRFLNLGQAIPFDLGNLISPEQKARVIENVAARGGDVNFAKQKIDDYNAGKINQNELINSNMDKVFQNQQRKLGLESTLKNFVDTQLGPTAAEEDKNVAYDLIKKEADQNDDLTTAWKKVGEEYQAYKQLKDKFIQSIPESEDKSIPPHKVKNLNAASKKILDTYPAAYDALEAGFDAKGYSPLESARVLKPLSPGLEKTLSKAPDYAGQLYPSPLVKGGGWSGVFKSFFNPNFSDENMIERVDNIESEQRESVPKLSKELSKNWDANTSLLNIYADLKMKGWVPSVIFDLFDSLSDKFTTRQNAERVQVTNVPQIPLRRILERK